MVDRTLSLSNMPVVSQQQQPEFALQTRHACSSPNSAGLQQSQQYGLPLELSMAGPNAYGFLDTATATLPGETLSAMQAPLQSWYPGSALTDRMNGTNPAILKPDTSNVTCNCKKSRCLKLYCQCFAAQSLCNRDRCKCQSCENGTENELARQDAIVTIQQKNPDAFNNKFQIQGRGHLSAHKLGCKCRKSQCLKKYCECFNAGVRCAQRCACHNCQNVQGLDKIAMARARAAAELGAVAVASGDSGIDGTKRRRMEGLGGAGGQGAFGYGQFMPMLGVALPPDGTFESVPLYSMLTPQQREQYVQQCHQLQLQHLSAQIQQQALQEGGGGPGRQGRPGAAGIRGEENPNDCQDTGMKEIQAQAVQSSGSLPKELDLSQTLARNSGGPRTANDAEMLSAAEDLVAFRGVLPRPDLSSLPLPNPNPSRHNAPSSSPSALRSTNRLSPSPTSAHPNISTFYPLHFNPYLTPYPLDAKGRMQFPEPPMGPAFTSGLGVSSNLQESNSPGPAATEGGTTATTSANSGLNISGIHATPPSLSQVSLPREEV